LELGRDTECGEPGEEVADWPVEVEQEVAGAADDGAQLDRGCRPHGVSWWLMVVQMLSNQARASSTYWDPIELSSSLMVWWNSTASCHQVVDGSGFAVEGDLVLAHGVEAEERFLVVEDVELEQRGEAVDADLHGGLLHQAQVG
jgi:hypothetical protein